MDSTDPSTDNEHIRPVSSLRSLFEHQHPPTHTNTAPPFRPKPSFSSKVNNDAVLPRGSFDSSRPNVAWAGGERAGSNYHNASGKDPSSASSFLGSSPIKRSASLNSLSSPNSPLLITVESPQSPRKDAMGLERPAQDAFSKPAEPKKSNPSSVPPPVPPPRGRNRIPSAPKVSPGASPNLDPDRSMRPPPRPTGLLAGPISTKPIPPPINRADKPRLSKKEDTIKLTQLSQPYHAPRQRSKSPFSNPPSSDDEAEKSSSKSNAHHDRASNQRDIALNKPYMTKTLGQSRLPYRQGPPSPKRHSQKLNKSADARMLGFSGNGNDLDDPMGEKPELPPRREPEQRAAENQESARRLPTGGIVAHDRSPSASHPTRTGSMLPPKRIPTSQPPRSGSPSTPAANHLLVRPMSRPGDDSMDDSAASTDLSAGPAFEHPDISTSNRRPPSLVSGLRGFNTDYDARLVAICSPFLCTSGHSTRAWDLDSGQPAANLFHGEREVRVTALAFKPGTNAGEEGTRLWLGTNHGDLQEVDILGHSIAGSRSGVHERRQITAIHRHQNSMWTIDDGGRLCVWGAVSSGLPQLHDQPECLKVGRGQMITIVIHETLWVAAGKEIRVFRPLAGDSAAFTVLHTPLSQTTIGTVTAAAALDSQLDHVYFGHSDGKVSIYSSSKYHCLNVISVSMYKVVSLAGVGSLLWAGYNTGMIYVYDTQTKPWKVKKEWQAHHGSPVLDICVDRGSLWKLGESRVVSIGTDSAVRIWDGTLEDDWRAEDMSEHDVDYCSFQEFSANVISWNAGAATPTHLRQEDVDSRVFARILQSHAGSDLFIFGFQELVDLEDKKLTAKSIFKSGKKKDSNEHEHMSRQYRAWRDYLVRCVEDAMPSECAYQLVQTSSMVGLFSCVFIKSALHSRIRSLDTAEIKRGMGGLHGNKGALIIRFILDDTSVCLVNCHLAAGQTQTVHRNNDMTAILDSTILPAEHDQTTRIDEFTCGGDGSMIFDNEICILNGDLNYRIDTMGRDVVVKTIETGNYQKLLERDQLLVTRRRNPGLRLLALKEYPITFAPTYKYDVGTDRYDTSEKRRVPAWCDRILYRGPGKIKQIDYQRHELRVSDHRPVSAFFKLRIKQVSADKRQRAWTQSEKRFRKVKDRMTEDAKISYLRDILGVPAEEAGQLV